MSSPTWILSLGVTVLLLVTPRPSVWWLSAAFCVAQGTAGGPQLRDTERRTLASFARHVGRRGALTLTNERLLFNALGSSQDADIALSSIRRASIVSTLGIRRGIEIEARSTRWRFLVFDPERWLEQLHANTQEGEVKT